MHYLSWYIESAFDSRLHILIHAYLNTLSRLHILIHCRNISYLNTWPGDHFRLSAAIAYLNTWGSPTPVWSAWTSTTEMASIGLNLLFRNNENNRRGRNFIQLNQHRTIKSTEKNKNVSSIKESGVVQLTANFALVGWKSYDNAEKIIHCIQKNNKTEKTKNYKFRSTKRPQESWIHLHEGPKKSSPKNFGWFESVAIEDMPTK